MLKLINVSMECNEEDAVPYKVNTIIGSGYIYERLLEAPLVETQADGESHSSSVVHPFHYNMGKYEVIDVINDWQLNFQRGNAVKYIARAGRKDAKKEVEDLEKARYYLNYEIERLKNATV